MLYSPYAGFRDGWITCVAKASLTDGQTVTLTDSNGNIVWIGEWDTNGIITPGRTALDISTAVTATDCATVLANAVTANCPHLTVYSASTPTLYFVKNTRIGYLSVAVSGGITAFAPRGTFSSVSYTASGPEQGAFLPTFGSEGTDQSPSFGSLTGKNRINAVTTDTSPYSFFFVAFDNSAASSSAPTVIMMDRVSERPASSWDDAVLSAGNGLPSYVENGSVRAHAWIGPASSRGWGSVQPMETTSDGSNVLVNPAGPTDPWTQQSAPQPVQYVRRPVSTQGGPGQYGWTGKSLLLAWNTSDQAYGDLLNTTATGDRACFSLFSIPWNNTPIVQ